MTLRVRGLGVVSESLIVLASFLVAVLVRFRGDLDELLAYRGLVPKALLCVVVVVLTLYYAEMYEYRSRRRTELFLRLGQCMAVAAVALAVIFFAVPGLEVGRGIFGLFVFLAWGGLLLWRLGAPVVVGQPGRARGPRPHPRHRRLRAQGGPGDAQALADRLPGAGLPERARGGGGPGPGEPERHRHARRPASPGGLARRLADRRGPGGPPEEAAGRHAAAVPDGGGPGGRGGHALRGAERPHPAARPAAELAHLLGRLRQAARPQQRQAPRGGVWRRSCCWSDRPPRRAAGPARADCRAPGPVLYRQTRVGLDGRTFELLKWRTMRTDAECGLGPRLGLRASTTPASRRSGAFSASPGSTSCRSCGTCCAAT